MKEKVVFKILEKNSCIKFVFHIFPYKERENNDFMANNK